MVIPSQAPRSTRSPSPQPPADFLARVKTAGQRLPNRVVLHGVEGVGKTSFGANAPAPIFLMARGETGLETLIDAGQLPETPHFPEVQDWNTATQALEALRTLDHEYKTVVLDTLNGFERLCHEHVCQVNFNGDWSEKGFSGYMRGYEVALPEWRLFLSALDRIREERRCSILCLAHTKVATFKNPEGPDYDRYTVDMHTKTWGLTHKWADMVLFATFHVETEKQSGRVKGVGGQQRILYTERHASYDSKNRHGLPEEIDFGTSGTQAWSNFIAALQVGRGKAGEVAS